MFSWARIEPMTRQFTGDGLRKIAFPLGAIGTGTVSLGGRGNLCDWEVYNRPAKGRNLPYTFFAIWAREDGARPVARVLERRILPPYEAGFGLPTGLVSGLPRLDEAVFTGAYPIARVEFADEALPVALTLEAFNPFIPMDDKDSGIPCAVFAWSVTNAGRRPVDLTICFSMLNACGLDGLEAPGNRHHAQLGRNVNRWVESGGVRGISMSCEKYGPDHIQHGTLAMATTHEAVTYLTRWERAGWWDDVQSFWDDFAGDGRLPNGPEPEPSPDGESDVGSLGVVLRLEPGQSAEAPFILAWRFPNLHNHWNDEASVRGARLGNWYCTQWSDAWQVAEYVAAEMPRLVRTTQTFADDMFDSTLPVEVLDAASANMSTIRTTTCLRTEDGRFHGFEGCGDTRGCCPMNCTHVWNYEQAVAFLFPALERTMRETDFGHNTRPSGDMAFRTLLPLKGELWAFKPAADGQMGTIMKAYREWLQCGDRRFLERVWPGVRRAMEFAWSPGGWDADQDGVMEGEQHNTYDIEFHGPNTMMGTLYLGALRACEEMARAVGSDDLADRCRSMYEKGRIRHVELLWNGEFFEQIVLKPGTALSAGGLADGSPDYPRYQHGRGCLSDHLLGAWFARVVGLGDVLPADELRKAVKAIHARNFRSDLREHHSVQRVYGINDEAGLLLCTWPNGGRPAYPFPYADEIWTGIEYQVAAHLLYEGWVDEGLEIVRAVRDRHNGAKRNPWNEPECGHHYARAMSSWSLLLALSGYHYNAAEGLLQFAPLISDEPFRSLFTAGSAWGVVEIQPTDSCTRTQLRVDWGGFRLRTLHIPLRGTESPGVAVDGQPVAARLSDGAVVLDAPILLDAGATLTVAG